ncbi:hypothetical protein L7F22_008781 [Adiantum nelumboides]|nr:hypothetical protein [Adiantum nelumboides]
MSLTSTSVNARSYWALPLTYLYSVQYLLRIFLVVYRSPDVARVRTRMLYASSKDRFKRELDVTYEIQATDPTEIEIGNIQDRAY